MGLTRCPDCDRQVSTEAPACPGCGRPLSAGASQARPIFDRPIASHGLHESDKNRGTYIILGVLLGLLGIHNFYAGYYGRGAVQLAITVLLGWFVVGLGITGIWVLMDLFTVTEDSKGNLLR